jgi:hypothetical protein
MSCARIAVSASTVTTCGCTQDAAGNGEIQLLAVRRGHHHLARLQAGDQRRAWRDAQFAQLTGGHDQGRFATEDFLLGADDVATDRAHANLFAVRGGAMPPEVHRRGRLPGAGVRSGRIAPACPDQAFSPASWPFRRLRRCVPTM